MGFAVPDDRIGTSRADPASKSDAGAVLRFVGVRITALGSTYDVA
jgi:hypothetical protein